ncbi:MAG: AIPR family protein [Planctomycetes bacterium]|nr:AIPR family protein [Planctomycetota bacterium]
MTALRFPTQQFRSIPSPTEDKPTSKSPRIGIFYTHCASVPVELWNWREVNPREVNRRSSVYRSICQTLTQEPHRFHERNRGITIVADDLSFDDKHKEVVLHLSDSKLHGVVDGAHTLDAILEAQKQSQEDGWPSYVFVKAFVGVDADQIAEIAGGLNTSQQVDLKSLENLREHFDELQRVLARESYADSIAYKMNEVKPVDVREILYYLAVFDCDEYSKTKHPVALFGRKEGIVRRFAEQAVDPNTGGSFRVLISKAPEILRLRDLIEQKALTFPIGRYKVGKGTRVRSQTHKENHLVFLNEDVSGKVPLGWIMPMLAGFRANVDWQTPPGTFSWTVPIDELLDTCIEELVQGIQDVHENENSRPEYVGRNAIAWRMSYNVVAQAILRWQLDRERRFVRK